MLPFTVTIKAVIEYLCKLLLFLTASTSLVQVVGSTAYANVFIFTPCVNGLQVDVNGGYYNSPTNVIWEWGDGQQPPSIYFPETHTYASAGEYTIKITAYYNDGTSDSVSQTVDVGPGVLSGCYALTITAGNGGSVSYQADVGSGVVAAGSSVTIEQAPQVGANLTANPSSLFSFVDWSPSSSLSGCPQGAPVQTSSASCCVIVDADSQITANFSPFSPNFSQGSVLYVENNNNAASINTILELNSSGNIVGTISSSLFNADYASLVFDSNRNLYVANYSIGTILKVTPNGTVSTFATGFDYPTALAIDSGGNLYVANHFAGTISKVTPGGSVSTLATGFGGPNGLAFDSDGNLYVSCTDIGAIATVTPTGIVSTFATGFIWPAGLVFDSSGNLYVANQDGSSISKVSPTGSVATFASGITQPIEMVFDSSGNLYVSSLIPNGLISVVTPNGQLSTFATGLNWPGGLAIGPAITPLPIVTTGFASSITANSATLNGSVNPNGLATTAYFQWGTTTSYGNNTPPESIGSGTTALNVYEPISGSGLNPNNTYHFQLVANNSGGTAYGGDQTFTTLSGGTPPSSPPVASMSVSANSAPADGTTPIIATVTLQGVSGSPVVSFDVEEPANQITYSCDNQFSAPPNFTVTTSGNQVTATITATTPGTATITAFVSSSLGSATQTTLHNTVTFTPQSLATPNLQLTSAIDSLYNGTATILNGNTGQNQSLSQIAVTEGPMGPYFYGLAEGAGAQAIIGAVFQAAGELTGGAETTLDGILTSFLQNFVTIAPSWASRANTTTLCLPPLLQ